MNPTVCFCFVLVGSSGNEAAQSDSDNPETVPEQTNEYTLISQIGPLFYAAVSWLFVSMFSHSLCYYCPWRSRCVLHCSYMFVRLSAIVVTFVWLITGECLNLQSANSARMLGMTTCSRWHLLMWGHQFKGQCQGDILWKHFGSYINLHINLGVLFDKNLLW